MNENNALTPDPNQQSGPQAVPLQSSPQTPWVSGPSTIEPTQNAAQENIIQQNLYQTPPSTPPQTATESVRGVFRRRIGRLGYLLGYFYSFLSIMALFIILFLIMPAMSLLEDSPFRVVLSIPVFIVGMIIVALTPLIHTSLIVRRLHDLGHPWFWILLLFVPLVGFIFSLYLLFAPGQKESNQWGEPESSQDFLIVLGLKM